MSIPAPLLLAPRTRRPNFESRLAGESLKLGETNAASPSQKRFSRSIFLNMNFGAPIMNHADSLPHYSFPSQWDGHSAGRFFLRDRPAIRSIHSLLNKQLEQAAGNGERA
jgi:hypothetical protein